MRKALHSIPEHVRIAAQVCTIETYNLLRAAFPEVLAYRFVLLARGSHMVTSKSQRAVMREMAKATCTRSVGAHRHQNRS